MFTTWWMVATDYMVSPWTWCHFALGAIVGSFLNVCILRIPKKTFWRNTRSVCPNCESPIPWYHNIPILSFYILRGQAACCHVKLSRQYPLVEFLTGAAFIATYWYAPYINWSAGHAEILWPNFIRFMHLSVFVSLMIVCSAIDLKYMIIPDVISIPMILVTPIIVYYHPELDWKSALFGVVVGGGVLYFVAWIYWMLRREIGLGFGDVKLLAAVGGWLGVQAIVPTILIGSVLGTVVGMGALLVNRQMSLKSALPFGPFLAFGACFHMLFNLKIF